VSFTFRSWRPLMNGAKASAVIHADIDFIGQTLEKRGSSSAFAYVYVWDLVWGSFG